jgi:IS30 family transposase
VVAVGRREIFRDVERAFWRLIGLGWQTHRAAFEVGVSANTGERWFREAGGMPPVALAEPSGRYLSLTERETIDLCWAEGWSQAQIARELGRHRSTVSRELRRNRLLQCPRHPPPPDRLGRRPAPVPVATGPGRRPRLRYRAAPAQAKAELRARRPKPGRLAAHPDLRELVQAGLMRRWSPQQISRALRREHPDRPELQVSHETIYRSLYVQGRGELRRELARCLRTGRALRRPQRRTDPRRTPIKDMVLISERPAEAGDRAVPGHWEGDLILGTNGGTAIGTLVERSTRFCLLLHLPDGFDPPQVRDAMIATMGQLPTHLRRTLTWDQGLEMRRHREISVALDLPIYFCDPHSPWQRGSNENTNGLLRQYFPKGTDLSVHTAADLAFVAAELNGRPRMTLDWRHPGEALAGLLSAAPDNGVATTG